MCCVDKDTDSVACNVTTECTHDEMQTTGRTGMFALLMLLFRV